MLSAILPKIKQLDFVQVEKTKVIELVQEKKLNYNLQALRGILAIIVLLNHSLGFQNYLDPHFYSNFVDSIQPRGQLRVFVFFILSGYVIGISNKKPLDSKNILPFLKKRFVRLYPIYFIGILIAILLATTTYSYQTIAANFTYTQFLFADIIHENSPMWSLQYEVFYLLLFIPISYFRINPLLIAFTSIFIGLLNYFLNPVLGIPILSSYAFGMVFWSFGLILSKYLSTSNREINYPFMIGLIILLFYIYKLNIFSVGLYEAAKLFNFSSILFNESVNWYNRAVTLADFTFLPYCGMFIIVFAGANFKFKNHIFSILLVLPLFALFFSANEFSKSDT